jgi:hypothetical protein
LLASVGKLLLELKKRMRYFIACLVFFGFELQHNTIIQLLVLLYVYLVTLSTKPAYHLVCDQGIFSIFAVPRSQKGKRNRQRNSMSTIVNSLLTQVSKYGEDALDYLQKQLGRNKRRRSTGRDSCFQTRKQASKSRRVNNRMNHSNVQKLYVNKHIAPRRFYVQYASDYSRKDPRRSTEQKGHKTQCGNRKITAKKQRTKTLALSTEQEKYANKVFFDTDSYEIKLDTGCSYSISGTESDFIPGTVVPVQGMTVGAYGGTKLSVTGVGTLKWAILDDAGRLLELVIPDSLYVKSTNTRLLSPQHYAQVGQVPGSKTKVKFSTIIKNNCFEMIWSDPQARKIIELDSSNIGTMYTAPGYSGAKSFFACTDSQPQDDEVDACCYQCTFEADAFNATKVEGAHLQLNAPIDDRVITDKGTLFEKAEK